MKILQIHNKYRQPGGEEGVVATEASLLREGGHEVIQHVAQNPSSAIAATRGLILAPWNPGVARAAQELAEDHRPDIAHVHNTWFVLSPSIYKGLRSAGVPVVLTLHNYRLLCTNGSLFRDGRPCFDCVGTNPWHGVRHRCYRNSAAMSAVAATTIALHRHRGTWDQEVDLFLALTDFARELFICRRHPCRQGCSQAQHRVSPRTSHLSAERIRRRPLRRPPLSGEGRGASPRCLGSR
jgi:hypothetical protein